MTDNKLAFAKNLYTEIAQDEDGRCLVKNQVSQQIYLKKTLDVYSIPVFAYLKEHHDVHLPAVEDYWQEDSRLVVIEELISGHTLEYVLENENPDEAERMDMIKQICDGVTALHQAVPKIIHRDLKASNIMITQDHVVKIIDYDAAKIYHANEKKDTVLIGTEGSAAPEQYGFMPSDERTDIYALGILIQEMFPHDIRMQRIGEKAASFSPEDRYSSVEEMKQDMNGGFAWKLLLCNMPGIRSRHLLVKIISAVLYAVMFAAVINTKDFRVPKQALIGICCCMMLLGWIDLYGHWTGLFDHFPLIHHANLFYRILGYILGTLAVFLFWALIDGTLQSLLKI